MLPDADSAGIPFEGRQFRPHPFAGDDGSAPDALSAALDRWVEEGSASAIAGIVEALRHDRVLVPLIAQAGDIGHTSDGRVVDKTQELSIVTVAGPDLAPVGLMFSAVEALAAWRVDARPQPVEATRVAAWALDEEITRLVLNPTSDSECLLRRGALVALLSGEPYVPPWEDTDVANALERGLAGTGKLLEMSCGWNDGAVGPDLVVTVGLSPGLSAEHVRQLQSAWAEQWSGDPVMSRRVDGLKVSLVAL